MMEITTMLAEEPITQTPIQADPSLDGPVIVTPSTAGAFVQQTTTDNDDASDSAASNPGIEGEQTIWEGHYSIKNFIGRFIFGILIVLGWLYLGFSTRNPDNGNWSVLVLLLGIAVLAFWLNVAYRFIRAYRGHHFRLTTRRLFVTTGFFQRRVDQLELLRIKDVYIQQSMIGDWLRIGNVIVISSEASLPKAYLLGIDDPRNVMDLIWNQMRLEQAEKTSPVKEV